MKMQRNDNMAACRFLPAEETQVIAVDVTSVSLQLFVFVCITYVVFILKHSFRPSHHFLLIMFKSSVFPFSPHFLTSVFCLLFGIAITRLPFLVLLDHTFFLYFVFFFLPRGTRVSLIGFVYSSYSLQHPVHLFLFLAFSRFVSSSFLSILILW